MWKAIGVAGLLVGSLAGLFGQQAEEGQHQYAGAESCFVCHIDFARKWAQHSHSKELLKQDRPANLRGCEACHGPGAKHIAGSRGQIVRWKTLEPARQNEICLRCHDPAVQAAAWEKNPHNLLDLSCTFCHTVHGAMPAGPMLRQARDALCDPCHADSLRTAVAGKTHHPLEVEGLQLECGMCHNLHGTAHERSLLQPQEQLCTLCHGEDVPRPESHQAGEWLKQHGKAWAEKEQQDQCLMCHNRQQSCETCHGGVPMPHAQDFSLKHTELARKAGKNCLNCHEASFCALCHEELPLLSE